MLTIDYTKEMRQSIIEKATFNMDNGKQLILSIVNRYDEKDSNNTLVIGQYIKIQIRDDDFGLEELSVIIGGNSGLDLIRILQRLFRQTANFQAEVVDDNDNDE